MKKVKLMMITLIMCFVGIMIGCNPSENKTGESERVLNEGIAIVENGKGVNDTIPYKCIGCEENLSFDMFDKVKNQSSELAKNNLNNPLSFKPISMDIVVIREDSLYSFDTNKKIDSVITIINTYKYIGQNAYGTEMGGEQLISFTLINGLIKDISDDIRLKDLKFEDDYINRELSLTYNDNFIDIIPTKDKRIIVKSSISCVDEGTWFLITLLNGEEIKLTSWNDFNCDGISYFRWFSKQQINKLRSNKIKDISVVDDKAVSIIVPKNKSDYFQQLLNL